MDWNMIVQSLIAACIPATISYLISSKQTSAKIKEIEKTYQADMEKMKLEYELRLKEKEADSQNEFAMKFLNGELDLTKSLDGIEQLEKLSRRAQKMQSTNFVKNK